MLLAIMSTTLANPVMNIGSVAATTINQDEVSTATVVDESIDTNSISKEEVASDTIATEPIEEVEIAPIDSDDSPEKVVSDDSSDKVVSDDSSDKAVSNDSQDNSDSATVAPEAVTKIVAPKVATTTAADSTVAAKDGTTTSSAASSNSVSISPLAQDLCNDSNSEPPKFTAFVQHLGTNNFDVTYFGDEPANYGTTSITVNLNFGNEKAAIATNSVAQGNFDFVFDGLVHTDTLYLTPDEAIALAKNMKQHGNDPSIQ